MPETIARQSNRFSLKPRDFADTRCHREALGPPPVSESGLTTPTSWMVSSPVVLAIQFWLHFADRKPPSAFHAMTVNETVAAVAGRQCQAELSRLLLNAAVEALRADVATSATSTTRGRSQRVAASALALSVTPDIAFHEMSKILEPCHLATIRVGAGTGMSYLAYLGMDRLPAIGWSRWASLASRLRIAGSLALVQYRYSFP